MGLASDLGAWDFHVQLVGLIAGREGGEVGLALLTALYSLLKGRSVLPALVVVGQMAIQGYVVPLTSLAEILQLAIGNGARLVLIPVENKRHFLEVPAIKALGIN